MNVLERLPKKCCRMYNTGRTFSSASALSFEARTSAASLALLAALSSAMSSSAFFLMMSCFLFDAFASFSRNLARTSNSLLVSKWARFFWAISCLCLRAAAVAPIMLAVLQKKKKRRKGNNSERLRHYDYQRLPKTIKDCYQRLPKTTDETTPTMVSHIDVRF